MTFVWKFYFIFLQPLSYSHNDMYIDDPETFKDAPICIQVIGKTLEEEAIIAIGEIVNSALKSKVVSSKL